jgi:hypothetical protein
MPDEEMQGRCEDFTGSARVPRAVSGVTPETSWLLSFSPVFKNVSGPCVLGGTPKRARGTRALPMQLARSRPGNEIVQILPPHPFPLPATAGGERVTTTRHLLANRTPVSVAPPAVPSPRGEGQGEGQGTVQCSIVPVFLRIALYSSFGLRTCFGVRHSEFGFQIPGPPICKRAN